jgi:phage repressor protein C with HTH and peptisase S24 domain
MGTATISAMRDDLTELRARRLTEAREKAGFRSARAAALAHNWKESSYKAHERGTRPISLENALKYAAAFDADPKWIWGERVESRSNQTKVTNGTLTRVLPNVGSRRDSVPLSAKRLNVLGRAAGSPEGELIMDAEAVDTVPSPAILEDVAGAYAVYVVGESMEPRYRAGELVYVHPNKPYRRGDYVVVQVDVEGEERPHGFIKQFVTLTPTTLVLRQLNPDREVEFPRKKVLSIHRIVMSGDS